MFSLAKIAYYVCNEQERWLYDSLETVRIDLLSCCEIALSATRAEVHSNEPQDVTGSPKNGADMSGDRISAEESAAHRFERLVERSACQRAAAGSGHLDCLRWARNNGCPWDDSARQVAASNGRLECLRYLHENGWPWDDNACEAAASSGQVECLRYLHENGCLWDSSACRAAARRGRLECLRYLHENGCPWDDMAACEAAASNGQVECLWYLYENGCPQAALRLLELYV